MLRLLKIPLLLLFLLLAGQARAACLVEVLHQERSPDGQYLKLEVNLEEASGRGLSHYWLFFHKPLSNFTLSPASVREAAEVALEHFRKASRPSGWWFLTLTVFPDPGNPGTTSCDGDIGTNNNTVSYANAHANADCIDCSGSTLLTTENSGSILCVNFPDQTVHYSVIRSLVNFDTSALTSSATISAATLSVKPVSPITNFDSDFVRIVTNSIVSNVAYATSDFNLFTTTAQATDINVSSFVAATYADFTLNSTGRGNISKTGVSHFGLRCGLDINSTVPVPAPTQSDCFNNSVDGTAVFYNSADTSGTSSDPKLVITYTLPGGNSARNGDFFFTTPP